jgi:predicted DNA-binding transcriptional regulator AlpA
MTLFELDEKKGFVCPDDLAAVSNIPRTKRFISPDELAKILSVTRSWVYAQMRKNPCPLPFLRLGKYLRFDVDEVLASLRGVKRTKR